MTSAQISKSVLDIALPIQNYLEKVKANVENELLQINQFTDQIGSYLTKMQGKYFRAMLTLLSAYTLKQDLTKTMVMAQCAEMLHLASLIHDDVLDNSDLRRGQKTIQNIWGNHVAILVGDYLYTRTTQMMIDFKQHEVMENLAQITLGLTEGELLQLSLRNQLQITLEQYFKVLSLKTAKFMGSCALFGGVLLNLPAEKKQALQDFGYYLGMAFQISDDLMDWTAQINEPLKPVQHDLMEGTISLPLLLALQKASDAEKNKLEQLLQNKDSALNPLGQKIVHQYDGLKQAQTILEDFGKKAKEILHRYEWNGPLTEMVDFIIGRIKV
jgi:octaprenyl-diphosphate synthase